MSFRSWLYVFATIGLILSGSVQAQEQTGSPNSHAADQSNPTDKLPLGFPIRIVEDSIGSDARESREREATQREKDDLIAQQRMAIATEAMNEATQSMKNAAWWSFGAVFFGTLLLTYTLKLTRDATRAAQAAVLVTREIGEAQTCAWLQFVPKNAFIYTNDGFSNHCDFEIDCHVKNIGSTSATDVRVETTLSLAVRGGCKVDITTIHFKNGVAFQKEDFGINKAKRDLRHTGIESLKCLATDNIDGVTGEMISKITFIDVFETRKEVIGKWDVTANRQDSPSGGGDGEIHVDLQMIGLGQKTRPVKNRANG